MIRGLNVYGDPAPWPAQRSPAFTVLSFLNTTKYPPSLAFVLMTLGPALLALAWFDRRALPPSNPLVVFGRVPLFYFVAHFYAAHVAAALFALVKYGGAAWRSSFTRCPRWAGRASCFRRIRLRPVGGLVVWAAIVIGLYPACRWFASSRNAAATGGWRTWYRTAEDPDRNRAPRESNAHVDRIRCRLERAASRREGRASDPRSARGAGACSASAPRSSTPSPRSPGQARRRSAPALVYGFPGTVLISVNDEVVHGVPGPRRLEDGDIVKLDVTVEKNGYVADAARTVIVGAGTGPRGVSWRVCRRRSRRHSRSRAPATAST